MATMMVIIVTKKLLGNFYNQGVEFTPSKHKTVRSHSSGSEVGTDSVTFVKPGLFTLIS